MSASALEHLKVLIVEDNQYMRSLLRGLLNSVGNREIAEANNGGTELDVLRGGIHLCIGPAFSPDAERFNGRALCWC